MAALCLGIARARLGPAAALLDATTGELAACEENRLTRARQAPTAGPPELAIAEMLAFLQRGTQDIAAVGAVRDESMEPWSTPSTAVAIGPHQAHAAYAFRATDPPAGDENAHGAGLALVCDSTQPDGWSAWVPANGSGEPVRIQEDIGRFPLTQIYGELTRALGLQPMRDEHLVESMARAGRDAAGSIADRIQCGPEGVALTDDFVDAIQNEVERATDRDRARRDVAASVQRRLGECLVELLRRLQRTTAQTHACLSGGLFFNTRFTTAAAQSRAFERTSVVAHPGRNGAAIGAALLMAGAAARSAAARALPVRSPYLGPEYRINQIKEALDNCKLSYDLLHSGKLYETVLKALSRGRLVGWFHGRLEWGPRALGHRSVVADPFAPHVLDNLNGFLKRRPAYRSYGVSVPAARLDEFFETEHVPASPFMQYEYRPRDRDRFRTILPPGVETLRVHTVDHDEPRFLRLLELWGEQSGVPVLVNTSFNGFHEPLVCSARDAIRVFYGTGLDVLALEDFILRK